MTIPDNQKKRVKRSKLPKVTKVKTERSNLDVFLLREKLDINDYSLIEQAFIHSSFINEIPPKKNLQRKKKNLHIDNQRLEFLGDAILDIVIKEYLYLFCPQADEGELSQLTGILVSQSSLAKLARKMKLNQLLILGKGERKNQGHHNSSNLADAFEALCGAIFLDQGYALIQKKIIHWYGDMLSEKSLRQLQKKDYKSLLQEYLQERGLTLPEYHLEQADLNKPEFSIRIKIDNNFYGKGIGKNRRIAEQSAAKKTMFQLART